MPYCNNCGHKNPDDNRFCEACGAPLQIVDNSSQPTRKKRAAASSSQGWQTKPKKKRWGCWKKLLGLVVVAGLAVWGISSWVGDSDEENVCEVSFDEADMVSDFQMDDIDWLIDYALNCSRLDQEFIKMMSNGFHDGELLSGVGQYSDDSDYSEIMQHIGDNCKNYEAAFNRLSQLDIFQGDGGLLSMAGGSNKLMLSATSIVAAAAAASAGAGGVAEWGKKKLEWYYSSVTGAKEDHDKIVATLRQMGAFGDKKMQEDIFSCINPEKRGGYKDARSFFAALNNGEMLALGDGQMYDILKNLEDQSESTYDKWVESAKALKTDQTAGEHLASRGKELTNKGVNFEFSIIDKLSGGGISNVQKIEQFIETANQIKKFINKGGTFDVTVNTDLHLKKRFMDKLRSNMPKTGSDAADKMLKYFGDYLENTALQDDETGENTKKQDKSGLEIECPDGTKAVIVVGIDGSLDIVLPNDKDYASYVTTPGTKRVSFVKKDGKRTKAQKVKVKKGKNKIAKKKQKTEVVEQAKRDTASVKSGDTPPKESHWKLIDRSIEHDNTAKEGTITECSFGKFRMVSRCVEDYNPSAVPSAAMEYFGHDNCKGEYLDMTITYTEPHKYYVADEMVEITYKSSTSATSHTCGVPGATGINAYGDINYNTKIRNKEGNWYFGVKTEQGELRSIKYIDGTNDYSAKMPKGRKDGDTLVITIGSQHWQGADIVRYKYVWVEVKEDAQILIDADYTAQDLFGHTEYFEENRQTIHCTLTENGVFRLTVPGGEMVRILVDYYKETTRIAPFTITGQGKVYRENGKLCVENITRISASTTVEQTYTLTEKGKQVHADPNQFENQSYSITANPSGYSFLEVDDNSCHFVFSTDTEGHSRYHINGAK